MIKIIKYPSDVNFWKAEKLEIKVDFNINLGTIGLLFLGLVSITYISIFIMSLF